MNTQQEPSQAVTEPLNKLSVAALSMAGISVLSLLFFGVVALAIFSVGAGHVSLSQIKARGGSGRLLALIALGIS